MKNEKLDRRVRYTKMVLRQSILELLKEKPLNKLTVTDICARADVNRNTFYTHYSSPLELLKSIADELLADLTDAVNSCEDCSDHSVMLNRICFVIYENSDICTVLFSENGD